MFNGDLRRAVLETLAYSDIFEFPLRLEEIHRYLPVRAKLAEVANALSKLDGNVETLGGYYFLAGRSEIVGLRRERERRSQSLLPFALNYGRILGTLPFIRMVALTGSLAVMNVSKNVDFDYMLVTAPGRLWTGRAFSLLLNRITRKLGHTLCPNLILAETALEWPLHDLYSARELYQMIPITGMAAYQQLIQANAWAKEFLPNGSSDFSRPFFTTEVVTTFKTFLEFPLRGALGDRFERWEMTRKIARFSQQEGFGEETIFNTEVCQGNFDHHRKRTRQAFEEKVAYVTAPAILPRETPSHEDGGETLENPSPSAAMGAYKS